MYIYKICVNLYMYIYFYMYICIYIYIGIYIYMYVYINMYIYINIYIYTYTYIYRYTYCFLELWKGDTFISTRFEECVRIRMSKCEIAVTYASVVQEYI